MVGSLFFLPLHDKINSKMIAKGKKKEKEPKKVVAKYDNQQFDIANCDLILRV